MSEIDTEVEVETQEEAEVETEETTTEEKEEPKEEKPKETLEQKKARLERELERTNKKLGIEKPKAAPVEKTTINKDGELDETQLDFLDLKGITDSEEIDVIQKVMQKTGQTVRQALKDDYVQSKLTAIRKEREVKQATPGSSKRPTGSSTDVDYWLSKYEQTGKLPDDFEIRGKVVEKFLEKGNPNKPGWRS